MYYTLLQADPDSAVQAVDNLDVILRIGLAAALGMIVGFERKKADKPLGSRTMALIAAGAAGFTLMGVEIASQVRFGSGLQLDPTRVLAYIITGVGFLGAGAILQTKKGISGMTTAASIWTSAGVGAACGLGLFVIAFTLFAVMFVMLWVPWLGAFRNEKEEPEEV